MKTSTTDLFRSLTIAEKSDLVMQVKETLATTDQLSKDKRFGAVDLWNIQRHGRPAFNRRRYV